MNPTQYRHDATWPTKCVIEGCGSRVMVKKRALCQVHYGRMQYYKHQRLLPVTTRACEECGAEMRLAGATVVGQKFCSTRCRSTAKRRIVQADPEKAQKAISYRYNWSLMKRYGITRDDYQRLLAQQLNMCAICGISGDEIKHGLVIDHDHVTGKVRGLLCRQCNASLGGFSDSIEVLNVAIAYLSRQSIAASPVQHLTVVAEEADRPQPAA